MDLALSMGDDPFVKAINVVDIPRLEKQLPGRRRGRGDSSDGEEEGMVARPVGTGAAGGGPPMPDDICCAGTARCCGRAEEYQGEVSVFEFFVLMR